MPAPVSRLILPGAQPPAGRLQILVPRGHETHPTLVCRVPIGDNQVCGKLFYPGEERAWQKHVGECARMHRDLIHAESPRTKFPAFQENAWDPEIASHMKRVGERMLEEGRMEVKPSERAGF